MRSSLLQRWVRRPGRTLALVQAVAAWPLWVAVLWVDRLVRSSPGPAADDIVGYRVGMAIVGAMCVGGYVALHPRGVSQSVARKTPLLSWMGFGIVAIALGVHWHGIEITGLSVAAIAASLVGSLYLGLGAVVASWAGGVLRDSPQGPCLEGRRHRYLLGEWPTDCEEGETLWLPDFQLVRSGQGPYRRGRAVGRSEHVLRDPDGLLVWRLVSRGLLFELWSFFTLAWIALSH